MKSLFLTLLLLATTCKAQLPDKTIVLHQGTVFPWQIVEAHYGDVRHTYFYWQFPNANYGTRKTNGKLFGYINYLYQQDLQNLIDMLRVFGSLPTNNALGYSGAGYTLETKTTDNYIYMEDWSHSALKISKTKARNFAVEIEKVLLALVLDPNER